ncbi:MAG: PorV/PorQ family protein [Planctomycetota bacterium]|jgi:hypothetical protein
MMKRLGRTVCTWIGLGTVLLCSLADPAHADENDYRMRIGEKMLTPYSTSPRAAGMGGTYSAINDGAHGTYQNPASLAGVEGHETFSTFAIETTNENSKNATNVSLNLGGALHLNSMSEEYLQQRDMGNRAAGLRYSYVHGNYDGFNGMTQSGNLINLAYGQSFCYGRVLAGISVGYHSTRIDDNDWTDMDLHRYEVRSGAIVRVSEVLALGAVFSFGNGDMEVEYPGINGKGDLTHLEIRGGASIQLNDRLMLSSDLSMRQFERAEKGVAPRARQVEEHEIIEWSVGTEGVVIPETLTARGGLFVGNDDWDTKEMPEYGGSRDQSYAGIAGGVSYYRDNWSLDYNLQLETTGDHNHYVSLLLEF